MTGTGDTHVPQSVIEPSLSVSEPSYPPSDPGGSNGARPWDKKPRIEQASHVLELLNRKANRQFPTRNPHGKPTANTEAVMALIKTGGYTLKQFAHVINVKVEQWGEDPERSAWLNPTTLFRRRNFEKYLGEERQRQGQTA